MQETYIDGIRRSRIQKMHLLWEVESSQRLYRSTVQFELVVGDIFLTSEDSYELRLSKANKTKTSKGKLIVMSPTKLVSFKSG